MGDTTDGLTRAQKFEDEKRRIVDTCFSKKDADGSQIESYITHIRIIEDAAYPSAPPPPNSPADNKKPRVIIVAVRKSGRVRVHKARENTTGSFSIGKTWNLDDLGPVQSFSSPHASSRQEVQYKEWASDTGFVVTLGKPYFWQAATYKEKEFFVGSLIKIYQKYTGGKSPELIGFGSQEEEQLLGKAKPSADSTRTASIRSPLPQSPSSVPPPAAASSSSLGVYPNRLPSTDTSRAPSRNGAYTPGSRADFRPPTQDGSRALDNEGARAPSRNGLPAGPKDNFRSPSREGFRAPSREGYRETRTQPSREQMLHKQSSEDQMPRMPGQFISTVPRSDVTPQSSQTSLLQSTPPVNAPRIGMNGPMPSPLPQNDDALRRLAGAEESSDDIVNKGQEQKRRPSENRRQSPPPEPSPNRVLPERRRPLVETARSFGQTSVESESRSKFSTPLATPEVRNTEIQAPINENKPSGAPSEDANNITQSSGYFPTAKEKMPADTRTDNVIADNASVRSGKTGSQTATDDKEITSPPSIPSEDNQAGEEHRPGLGPMIKKKSAKDIAGTFRRAALAANAFKPRAGGAAEKLMALNKTPTTSNEPDGITGVVPAPLLRGMSGDSARSGTPEPKELIKSPTIEAPAKSPFSAKKSTPTIQLQRKATEDSIKVQPGPSRHEEVEETITTSPDRTRSRSPGRRRRQMQEANIAKYCNALGIDPAIVEGRGGDFDDLLTELGWDGKLEEGRTIDDFQADIRREIGRAQAGGWLDHIEQQDAKVRQLEKLFDVTIAECDEMDGLLTLYQHELSTLAEDVAYIEAQGQGLQVQTANQKLLKTELENLLKTISISSSDLQDLREASLGSPGGVESAEQALAILYKAMLTIDPDIRQNRKREADAGSGDRSGIGVYADTELGQMQAVKDKKEDYREETQIFLRRLNQYMTLAFKMAEQRTSETLEQNRSGLVKQGTKLDTRIYNASRQELWMYNGFMLFVREVNSYEWQTLISTYELATKNAYQEQFRDNILAWKKISRKSNVDDQDVLFTAQDKEKDSDTLSTAARKLTVKRGKTVRVTGSVRQSAGERQDGKVDAFEAFAGALDEETRAISEEQNFTVAFFHLSSLFTADFADVVASSSPFERLLPNLSVKQGYDPDRDMAKSVEKVMDNMFTFWPADLQNLVDWTLKSDQLQGVGLLYVIEKKLSDYEETNQEFITRTLSRLHERLIGLFHRFVDEQIRGIEDTKVKIKKRKGVISFMRVFPGFSSAIEGMLPDPTSSTGHHESLEIRFIINEAYGKINKAMFESLNFIAKDNPGVAAHGSGSAGNASGDPEDKEALNYHILMIENMHHYLEEVETRENIVLEEWRDKATHELYEHMKQYTDAVIRRPLGKLLDFIESTESLMKSSASESSYTTIASKPSHSRSTAKKVTGLYDLKEIKKGVETLKKRVEKHFGDVDDPGVGRSLVVKIYGECSARYADAHDRMNMIAQKVYEGQGGLDLEWRKEEVAALFRR